MRSIPKTAVWLGLAGILPFIAGSVIALIPRLAHIMPVGFQNGSAVLIDYGTIILAFMSGCLWGFATKAAPQDRLWAFGASILPALAAFLYTGGGAGELVFLAALFAGLLVLDRFYVRKGLAPVWWFDLRMLITPFVVVALIAPVVAGAI